MTELRSVRVAAIQATPVILDAEASVAKMVALLEEAFHKMERGEVLRSVVVL